MLHVIISDDLTGGIDTGVCFAAAGFPTFMVSDPAFLDDPAALPQECQALSLSTASRALEPQEAYERAAQWARRLGRFPVQSVYKKIDSTMRGRIGQEIDAVMDAMNIPLAFVAPAFPEQGRVTVGGIHLLDGQPIGATEIGRDPLMPVEESSVPALLSAQSRRRTALVDLTVVAAGEHALQDAIRSRGEAGAHVLVFDAVRREHLRTIAQAAVELGRNVLAVGSAGLAREMAGLISPSVPRRLRPVQKRLPGGPVLVVCGSRSKRSYRQVARLCEETDIACISLSGGLLKGQIIFTDEEVTQSIEMVESSLNRGSVILTVVVGDLRTQPQDPGLPGRILEVLSSICHKVMESRDIPLSGLVLTGGDTAFAVLNKLGIGMLEIAAEVASGIPLAFVSGGRFDGLPVITKAGAFGKQDALVRCVEYLQKPALKSVK